MQGFGPRDWESLEFIPQAVGSPRKMLRLGQRGEGEMWSEGVITREAPRMGNTGGDGL